MWCNTHTHTNANMKVAIVKVVVVVHISHEYIFAQSSFYSFTLSPLENVCWVKLVLMMKNFSFHPKSRSHTSFMIDHTTQFKLHPLALLHSSPAIFLCLCLSPSLNPHCKFHWEERRDFKQSQGWSVIHLWISDWVYYEREKRLTEWEGEREREREGVEQKWT